MMEALLELDKEFFLYLNSLHAPWLDSIMLYVTQTRVWVPLYLFLLFLILKDYRNESWAPLLGIFLTVLLSDQFTSSFMKPYFARLRPSQDPGLEDLVHLVNGYKGGLYGFASSHAATTFSTASFFWMLFKHKRKWIAVLFIWAALMTYSRIYLGVHYPGDILVGILVGILSALAGFKLYEWLIKRYGKNDASTLDTGGS
jgi:undecaprenyl-diphosphatase